MSLLSREIELYDFTRGTRHWRYTDIDRPAIVEGQTYDVALGLKRSRIMQSPEESKNNIEITAPLTLPVLDLWRPFPPMARVHLQVRRVRVSDGLITDAWSGIVSDVEEDDHTATMRCQTLMAAVGANGLRRCWQVRCPLALYGVGSGACGVREDDFRTESVATFAAGNVVRAAEYAAHPDGYYDGGFIRWTIDGDVDYRFIVSHVGDTLTLLTPMAFPAGTATSTFPGCDHTLTTCDVKFGNAPNYGGQHTIPTKNPFSNDPVF